MADLQPTDTLLVNRAGVDYKVTKANLMATVLDTDELLVNRAGVDYKATYADVKKGFGPQQINPAPGDWTFNPAIVSGTGTQGDPYVITPATVPAPGGTVQSAQTLTLTGLTPNDLVEWTDHSVGAGNRFHQLLALVPPSGQVDLKLDYADTPPSTADQVYTGDLQIGTSYFRWVVTQVVSKAPDVDAVTLSDAAGGDRFTSVAFPVSATMVEDGVPTSSKKLKAYVEGALKSSPLSSAITQVNGNVLTLADNTQLANFAPGDAVTEVGGGDDATGTVGSVDTTANTITLSASTGTWDVGSQVKGPLKTVNKTPESDEIVQVAADTPAAGQTTLTLKTDKDLRDFASGDAVNQDSAYTPASSAIINVATGASGPPGVFSVKFWNQPVSDNTQPTQNWTDTPDVDGGSGNFTATGQTLSAAGITSCPPDIDHRVAIFMFDRPQAIEWRFVDSFYNIDTSMDGVNWTINRGLSLAGAFSGKYFRLLYANTIDYCNDIWIAGISPLTTLTLTDNTDLANFAAGDAVKQDDAAASGTVSSVDTGANTITLGSSTGTWSANTGNYVVGPSKTASGTVASADPTAKTITLSSSTGSWAANAGKFVVGPTKPSSSVKLYCKLDAAGAVSDLQSADPGFTAWTPAGTGPYTGSVTFPATLPTGQPPDTDLPAGTSLTVEVEASNTAGSDSAKSNTIVPA